MFSNAFAAQQAAILAAAKESANTADSMSSYVPIEQRSNKSTVRAMAKLHAEERARTAAAGAAEAAAYARAEAVTRARQHEIRPIAHLPPRANK